MPGEDPRSQVEVKLNPHTTLIVEVEGVIDVFYNASLTSQEAQHRVFYPDGHPSRCQPCPTELNFGVFPVVIAAPCAYNCQQQKSYISEI